MNHLDGVAFTIVIVSFLVVTCIGFAAARWRPAEDPMHLNEWGLGGRGFGTFVSWFLLGGDIYTAYTFIAVPALVYAAGAVGFYALSYTIMVWPIVFVFGPRLWSVARARGYVSPGEFVRGRHGSQGLGLAVAATGILATMPYIALQLVGIQSVLTVIGVGGATRCSTGGQSAQRGSRCTRSGRAIDIQRRRGIPGVALGGPGWVFAINAISFLAIVGVLGSKAHEVGLGVAQFEEVVGKENICENVQAAMRRARSTRSRYASTRRTTPCWSRCRCSMSRA